MGLHSDAYGCFHEPRAVVGVFAPVFHAPWNAALNQSFVPGARFADDRNWLRQATSSKPGTLDRYAVGFGCKRRGQWEPDFVGLLGNWKVRRPPGSRRAPGVRRRGRRG